VIGCLDVRLYVIKLFSNLYFSYHFYLIFTKLGTNDLCANTHKTVEQIFRILILNLWLIFEIFAFGLKYLQQPQQSYLG